MMRAWVAVLLCAACHPAREHPKLVIEVRAHWPGASADEVAAGVTAPLEHELSVLPHIAMLDSVSTDGATHIRVAFDGDDLVTTPQQVQAAILRAMPMLPGVSEPPVYSIATTPVGRFLVPREAAGSAAERLAQLPGVSVETCGELRREKTIDLDRLRLATVGLTITDVVGALRASSQHDLGQLEIAVRSGVPIHLRDIATIADDVVPPDCRLDTASVEPAELVVATQRAANADAVRASVAKTITGAIAIPRQRELHLDLAPDIDLEQTELAVHTALRRIDHYVVEVRPGSARILDGGEAVLAALRKAPVVLSGGEPTTVVHVSGADPSAVTSAARAIADRLQRAGTLVATHGLALQKTLRIDVDRDRAAELGVSASDIATTLAASAGVDVIATSTQPVVVRVPSVHIEDSNSLYVRGTGDALFPLESVTTAHETTGPAEILHRGLFPDVDLEVHGEPAIGAVPAGVHVEVDPYLGR